MESSKGKQILEKQEKIYQGNMEKEENNGNIQYIDLNNITDEKLQKAIFHYSLKKDKNSIDKNGLKSNVGRNSKGIDKLESIYFSYGLEAVLETWDVWLKWRASQLYSPGYQEDNKKVIEAIYNGTATEQEKREYWYKCQLWNEEFVSGKYREDKEKMKFLFEFQIDEMLASNYYLLDLKEGQDFSFDEIDMKKARSHKQDKNDISYKIFKEMYGEYSDLESIKVDKWNMNTYLGKNITITPDRIKQLKLSNGKSDILSIILFLHDKYKNITPKDEQVQFDLLDKYIEYAKEKIMNNELQQFDRNTKIDEFETISYFHDQKSDVFFQDMSTDVYNISKQEQTEKTQYLYHHTRVADLESILKNGLEVRNGVQSQAVKDTKTKVFFSEGMEGAIAMASAFQHKFDYMKSGTEWEDKTLEDFLEERVFLRFSSDGIENESDKGDFAFSDGWTSKEIPPEKLKVCLLKNIKTGKISYQRDDILKYMLAVNPIENFKNGNERQKEEIKRYYEERSKELSEFDKNEYLLEDMNLDKFFEQYIDGRKEPMTPSTTLSKESLFTQQKIGKVTVNTSTKIKDEAESRIQRDEQMLQKEQEIPNSKFK